MNSTALTTMTSRRAALTIKAFLVAPKKATVTASSTRSISAMMSMYQTFPDSVEKFLMKPLDTQDKISATQIFRAGSSNPFKEDFDQGCDTVASFLVTWPMNGGGDGSRDRLTASTLNALNALCENCDVQVTPAFHVMDGRGDKMATVCVQTYR